MKTLKCKKHEHKLPKKAEKLHKVKKINWKHINSTTGNLDAALFSWTPSRDLSK